MNASSTPNTETDAIRSEIESTRRQMDDKMDALRERFQGRHLIDEILGFFRNNPDRGREFGQKVSQSASTAMHSVTDTLKANPVPALLIGAGVAWMIYDSRRKSRDYEYDYEARYDDAASAYSAVQDDPDAEALYDRPLDYPSSAATSGTGATSGYAVGASGYSAEPGMSDSSSKFGHLKERASEATQQMRERLSGVGSRLRDRSQMMSQQARDTYSRVQERARETYSRGRERVVTTANEHPLEVGLACLAAGVIAGLSIPTPERLNRLAGPTVDRLRERTREAGSELLHKGERVATAAADAAKEAAREQGLTPEHLREQAAAVGDRARDAAKETARSEGLASGGSSGNNPQGGPTSSQPQADPLASRPVM
jgi:Protein of unknown function (DUF3618).